MSGSSRRPSGAGKVSLQIDFRAQEQKNNQDTAYWNDLSDVLLLLTLLQELVGSESQVFVDFGVITIRDVDLAALRARVATVTDN